MGALADLTWPEAERSGGVLAVPMGSTEQHGPHLPLTTDTDTFSGTLVGFPLAAAGAGGIDERASPLAQP